jgi:hypothetical protein
MRDSRMYRKLDKHIFLQNEQNENLYNSITYNKHMFETTNKFYYFSQIVN